MLRIVVLCLLLVIPGLAKSQDVAYSPYDNFDFRFGDFSVIGKIGEKLYTYRSSQEGFFLDAYNDKMERLATVVLDFFPNKIYQVKFITYPDQMLVLYQSVDGTKITQYAALLDNAGRLIKRPVPLQSEKTGWFNTNKSYFYNAVSEDKKHIITYGINEKGENLAANCVWIDDQLNIKRKANVSFKADNDITHGEGMMSNNGTFFLSAYTTIGNREYADRIWILSLKENDKSFTSKELPLSNNFAAGTYYKLDEPNGRIYAGGFYSDKKNGNYVGILYAYYDIAVGEFRNTRIIPFDEKIRDAAGDANKKRAFNNYQVRQMIIKNDGGFLLVAENHYITTRNSYAPGFGYYSWYYPAMSSTVREYHYDDILVMSYSADGNNEWRSFIRKEQYSQEDGGLFSSYAQVNTGGAVGFLFNDYNAMRSRIQLATVEPDGKVDVHPLLSIHADDPDWLPRSGKQVGAREIIVPCLRKRQICFAKVSF
jgi:hypothetical protein